MRGFIRVVLLAGVLGSGAASCGRAENPAALPAGHAPASDVLTRPESGDPAPAGATTTVADTTGRWGGGLGSGT